MFFHCAFALNNWMALRVGRCLGNSWGLGSGTVSTTRGLLQTRLYTPDSPRFLFGCIMPTQLLVVYVLTSKPVCVAIDQPVAIVDRSIHSLVHMLLVWILVGIFIIMQV